MTKYTSKIGKQCKGQKVIGVPEGKRQNGTEGIFEEIMAGDFPM